VAYPVGVCGSSISATWPVPDTCRKLLPDPTQPNRGGWMGSLGSGYWCQQ